MNPDQNPNNASSSMPPASAPAGHSAHQKNTAMAVLAYIGPLVIVSFAMAKADQFVKYHVKQGLILFIAEVVVWFLGMFFFPSYFLWMLLRLVDLIVFILAIIGIIYASKGEEKELPVIGSLAKRFRF